MKITRTLLALISCLGAVTALAASVSEEGMPRAHDVKAHLPIKAPVTGVKAVEVQRRALRLSCPQPSSIELQLFLTGNNWVINPWLFKPAALTKAYGQPDKQHVNKVSLGCVYQVNGNYTASVSYNGLQTCPANADGEGNIRYHSNLDGYTSNVAGTSAPGLIAVKKTGQRVEGQTLHCDYTADGKAQFFKVYEAESRILSCESSGSDVVCYY